MTFDDVAEVTDVPSTTVIDEAEASGASSPSPEGRWPLVPSALALVLAAALGVLGWRVQTPGGPLLVESVVVAGIGLGVSGAAWVLASFMPTRRGLWAFALLAAVASLIAGLWTFELAMPSSLAWSSSATDIAHRALLRAEQGPKGDDGVSIDPCTTVESGDVGPLHAPYRVCANPLTHGTYVVTFSVVKNAGVRGPSSPDRGLLFTDLSRPVEDACARHLVGAWWAFVGSQTGSCPFGYRFFPGG